jgi:LuxR family transcriptional regulator, maltose regulon positive regulatory protein
VSEAAVYASDLPGRGIRLDSAAWFSGLEHPAPRSFSYPIFDPQCGYIIGFLTVRKEARQRGGRYWVGYRRQGGRMWKRYLGQSDGVTAARLEELAGSWLRTRPPPERHGARGADGR